MNQIDAIARGLHKFLPDTACKAGHTGMRYTATNICCACHAISMRNYYRSRTHPNVTKITIWVARGDEDAVRSVAELLATSRGLNLPEITKTLTKRRSA